VTTREKRWAWAIVHAAVAGSAVDGAYLLTDTDAVGLVIAGAELLIGVVMLAIYGAQLWRYYR